MPDGPTVYVDPETLPDEGEALGPIFDPNHVPLSGGDLLAAAPQAVTGLGRAAVGGAGPGTGLAL